MRSRLLALVVVLGLLAPQLVAAQPIGKPRRLGFVSMRSRGRRRVGERVDLSDPEAHGETCSRKGARVQA